MESHVIHYNPSVTTPSSTIVGVTGATGFVGSNTVRTLLSRGYRVRALARDRAKAQQAFQGVAGGQSLEVVYTDIFDRAGMRSALAGCHALVHTIGIRREVAPDVTFRRHHVLATEIALDAAAANSVGRYAHVSALGVRPDAPGDYFKSKWEAEELVRGSGLEWTIFRPSLIHGPDGEFMQMIKNWVLGRSAPRFFMPYFAKVEIDKGFPPKPPKLSSALIAPVSVLDVAAAITESLASQKAVGEVYPLTGPETLDWPTLLKSVRDAMPLGDKKMKVRPIPGYMGWAMAMKAKILGLDALLPFGPSEPLMAIEDSTGSNVKARTHLGFNPAPFTSTMRAYADRI